MRLKIIAGNWKMNRTNPEALELVRGLISSVGHVDNPRVIICPPFTALGDIAKLLKGTSFFLGAQNMHFKDAGAYTGEIAPAMLLTIGVSYVILGHSERREYFSEDNSLVNAKLKLALKTGLIPIVCIGEKLEDRDKGRTEEVVSRQVDDSLQDLNEDEFRKLVIAYEPVWAIGTGKTATPEMAQEVHRFVRNRLRSKISGMADLVPILYGGSVTGDNAGALLAEPDIDGALVGGASLKVDQFTKIIKSA